MTRANADDGHVFRNRARAESFGSIAAQYDRARPPYPDALICELATNGGSDVLDVGCGTGKAAVLLAARGMSVLGVEIDAGMAAVARANGIEVEVGSFETWDDAGRRFDLITCAQAWHWVDPDVGAVKAVALLRPGGLLALFWNVHWVDRELRSALDAVYLEHADSIVDSMATRSSVERGQMYAPSLEAAGFGDITFRRHPWEHVYSRDEWLELLSTYSDHHLLPDDQRERLFAAVSTVIDGVGGSVTVHYETHTVLARV